jgi:polyferredoxin
VGWGSYFVYLLLPLTIFIVLSYMIAKAWCGWACPIGALEDGISWVRIRLGIPRKTFRRRTTAWIRPIKYVFLIFILLIAFAVVLEPLGLMMYANGANLPYCQVCPAKPVFDIFQMGMGVVPTTTVIAPLSMIALAIFLMGSLWVPRFWCWVCPIGGAIAPFQKITPLHIEKNDRKCTHCHACARVCPTQVYRVFEERSKDNVNDPDCILCMKCVEACPEGDCLTVKFFGKKVMKSRSFGR